MDVRKKREEIRELIDMILRIAPMPLDDVVNVRKTILETLNAKGCVLKVDRELPELTDASRCNAGSHTWNKHLAEFNYQQAMLRASYVAVEPLVEEAWDYITRNAYHDENLVEE